ncbi:AAA family ATPase [Cystobacter fuscus]
MTAGTGRGVDDHPGDWGHPGDARRRDAGLSRRPARVGVRGRTLLAPLAHARARPPLGAAELSDGTLRYLCLLAALLSPRPPFLALNEPETSLHPSLLEPLARLIADASRRGQLFVTTHAQELATALEKNSRASLLTLHRTGGATELAEEVDTD